MYRYYILINFIINIKILVINFVWTTLDYYFRVLQAFKTKEQLITHNCEQSGETKKHSSSQLPKKASGSFKPRRPTPKRQILSKTAIALADKEKLEKLKADEIQRKVIISIF